MNRKFSLKQMPKPQRYGFYFLSFLALGIISLWLWQFNYRLTSPFRLDLTDQEASLNQEMFVDFQDFDSFLEDDDVFSTSPIEGEDMLYDPDEVPDDLIDFPLFIGEDLISQDPLLIDEYEESLRQALSGEADPDSLRQLLLDGGLDSDMVNQLSDEELMEVYQEVLIDQSLP